MAKRSRHQRHHWATGPSATSPTDAPDTSTERLVARIRDGHLDTELPALIDAINERVRILDELQTHRSLAQLSVGTRVRLNDAVSPRYLQGQCGEVHDINDDHVVVCLDTPVGRFTSGHIRCSPRVLERIDDSGT
ncbi:MAG: hypothetical protein AB1679_32355 [Actinomycetota bacterium]